MSDNYNFHHELWMDRRDSAHNPISDYASPFLVKILKDTGHYSNAGFTVQYFGQPTPFRYLNKERKCKCHA